MVAANAVAVHAAAAEIAVRCSTGTKKVSA